MGKAKRRIAKDIKKNQVDIKQHEFQGLKQKLKNEIAAKHYADSLEVLAQLIGEGCRDAEIMYWGAVAYFYLGDYTRAASWIENTLTFAPGHIEVRLLLARLCMIQDRFDDAEAILDSLNEMQNLTEAQRQEYEQVAELYKELLPVQAANNNWEFVTSGEKVTKDEDWEIIDRSDALNIAPSAASVEKAPGIKINSLDRNQKFIIFWGGLGNQLSQYVFLRWLEKKTGQSYLIDDSFMCRPQVQHNGYELERIFGLDLPLMSKMIAAEDWNVMMERYLAGKTIPQQLLELGYPLTLVAESTDYSFAGNVVRVPVAYNSLLADTQGMIYYHGYWPDHQYFEDIKDDVLKELQFPALTDERNREYAEMIKNTNSVCIHIRRGDFLNLNWELDPAEYRKAEQYFESKDSNLVYYIFSDDIPWCKAHLQELGLDSRQTVFVEGNAGTKSYIDMQLMSYCKHFFIHRSSFSDWASMLSENRGGVIIRKKFKAPWEK
ncbi:alpha-1,2-fucosyltransferase [Selenomonas ruminis]|uniref:Tetratricopeptide repeat protein n=1 Tax=Selenomonas ruminis TaxID=2593411 RepID=A0A5D6W8I8_9FIRM|nr:alpha-1,2-fucosyltransferase [Selenomonas sp. mPRGC5]TYZ24156.1 tetratricopeptide repeat protein [Selenomonas sp. mPRGC5]